MRVNTGESPGCGLTPAGRRQTPRVILLEPHRGNSARPARVGIDMRVLFATTRGAGHFGPIVAERKRMLAVLRDWTPPPALGPMPEALNDPAVQMLWGITSERLEAWLQDTGDEREIRGHAASPGVVEGIARVLRDVNEIGQIQDGEILVCPVTAPSWGPVFGKIRAAVSDIGGTMSHAAIVAREYRMPAVVGTGKATQRIKTGQLLRVDGDRGIVRILE